MPSTFSDWRERGAKMDHRGRSIFFQSGGRGSGSAILCVHGFPTASWDFHRIWDRLIEKSSCVLAPDMIGFGWSDKPPAHPYSIADQADLHETLLRNRGVRRYRMLAHDYGDTVGQELLARHEERRRAGDESLVLDRVCFLNGGLFPEAHRARLVQKLMLGPLGPLVSRAISERAFGRSLSAVFGPTTQPSPDDLHEFWTLVKHGGGNRIAHRLLHYIPERRAFRKRWVGAIVEASIPVRFVNGLADPVSGAHMVARYRELVPNPDVRELPGIGHYPQVEAPDAVWKTCADLLFD